MTLHLCEPVHKGKICHYCWSVHKDLNSDKYLGWELVLGSGTWFPPSESFFTKVGGSLVAWPSSSTGGFCLVKAFGVAVQLPWTNRKLKDSWVLCDFWEIALKVLALHRYCLQSSLTGVSPEVYITLEYLCHCHFTTCPSRFILLRALQADPVPVSYHKALFFKR